MASLELLPTERRVVSARPHWLLLFRAPNRYVLLSVVAVIAVGIFGPFPFDLFAWLLVAFGGMWRTRVWQDEELLLTDRRILRSSGFLTSRQAYMSLNRVTDVTTEFTFLGKLLGYGAIDIESASRNPALARIDFIRRPEKFFGALRLEIYGRPGDHPRPVEPSPPLPDASKPAAP